MNPEPASVITILTDPIPTRYQYYSERAKARIRPLLRKLDGRAPLKKKPYGGHYAVTRSLIEGLRKAGIPFVYNPQKVDDCTEQVVVLAGVDTLKQALKLRRKGIIKKLAGGPNIVTLPSEQPELIGSEYLDRCIANSAWVRTLYEIDMPELEPKLIIWPAGVDVEDWKPKGSPKNPRSMLFYAKRPERQMLEECRQIAEKAGFCITNLKYGTYTAPQYKTLLEENSVMVHFVEQESQGISLCEAWSMDVPSIVWNPGIFFWQGHNVVSSSAPYLTDETGAFFRNTADFEDVIKKFASEGFAFSPRKWVLRHQTDELSARHLMELMKF
jgi:hypothetical protein